MTEHLPRKHSWLLIAILAIGVWVGSLLIAVQQLPHDGALGQDFLVFYAAGLLVHLGGNPYDVNHMTAIETHLHMIGNPQALFSFNPFGNPPLFAWFISAFTHWPAATAYAIWFVFMVAVIVTGLTIMARSYGVRTWGWALLATGLTPVFIIALFLGQPTPLLALSLAAALAALRSDRPTLAGLLLSLCWIKPHLIFPLVPVLLAMLSLRQAKQLGLGFLGGSLSIVCAPLLLVSPTSVTAWLGQLWHFYVMTTNAQQPGLSSIAGLYVGVASQSWLRVLTVLCLLLWLVVTIMVARYVRHNRLSPRDDAWQDMACLALAAWLFLAPYAHPADLVVLATVAAPLLIGRRGNGLADSRRLLALCTLVAAPEVDLLGFRPSLYFCYSIFVPLTIVIALIPWVPPPLAIVSRSMRARWESVWHG